MSCQNLGEDVMIDNCNYIQFFGREVYYQMRSASRVAPRQLGLRKPAAHLPRADNDVPKVKYTMASSSHQAQMEPFAGIARENGYRHLLLNGYSALWQKNPELLRNQAAPDGVVGFCSRCGKSGHLSQTGDRTAEAWCEHCYPIIARRMWMKQIGLFGIALSVLWGLKYVLL